MSLKPDLSPELCRKRQDRVRRALSRRAVDRAIILSHENIQYLTGFRPHRLMNAAVCLEVEGDCILSAPNTEPDSAAVDHCVTFEAQWQCTLRQDQMQAAADALKKTLRGGSSTVTGLEGSCCGIPIRSLCGQDTAKTIDIDPDLWKIRRRKDADELAMIGKAVECTAAMYIRAREIIRPGICELEVFNQLHAAAVMTAGEQLTAIGNDYQCNSPGGPPRERNAKDGELYILDLGPAYRGYYADNCRTIAVNGQPTDVQHSAWQRIVSVLEMVEQTVRPGVCCRQLFRDARAMLEDFSANSFPHHLGHGFGLFPHEAPHLNPGWDDVFEEGDCFTAEPGLYTPELAAGIRLEQNYVVTADGVDRLSNFELQL